MIASGLCSILASDYYYPAQLLAAFRPAADRVLPLPQACSLDRFGAKLPGYDALKPSRISPGASATRRSTPFATLRS
jgi:alpha-D-ribose 1-methylphosphonate 5-triphosphate diphosphatase PhnM